MAEPFLSLGSRERADVLNTVAARSGNSAFIREKDIWVCWVLQALFSMPNPHPMAFKGGTSLRLRHNAKRPFRRGGAPGFDTLIERVRRLETEANRSG